MGHSDHGTTYLKRTHVVCSAASHILGPVHPRLLIVKDKLSDLWGS